MLVIFAQQGPEIASWAQGLIATGPVGVFMWWLMSKHSQDIKENTKAVDRIARSVVVLVLGSKDHSEAAKTEMRQIQDEITQSEKERAGR